jgi:5'(3')-deoxyribonucleotidase
MKKTVLLDMDGVIADFDAGYKALNVMPREAALMPGFYGTLPVVAGARENVERLHANFNLHIATAPKWANRNCIPEKMHWLEKHFPYLFEEKRIIICPDKSLLAGDFLIDDHPEWNGADKFKGTIIKFEGDWGRVWQSLG